MIKASDQGDDTGGNRIKHIVAKMVKGGEQIIERDGRWVWPAPALV